MTMLLQTCNQKINGGLAAFLQRLTYQGSLQENDITHTNSRLYADLSIIRNA